MTEQENSIFGEIDLGSADVPEDFDPFVTGAENEDESNITQLAVASESAPAVQTPQSDSDESELSAGDGNPLAQAMAVAESKEAEAARGSLFSKLPKFEYAGASEDISDTSKTFEDLRLDKSSDFPELEDGKRVSWTVEYGKITKSVSDPKGTSVGKMKTQIETSKEFLDALKKLKPADRENAVCKIKPRITAQSKGEMPAYKGIFNSLDEAEQSGKVICFVPARDGNIYEMRKNEIGTFVTRASNVVELSEVKAGFFPALPRIPIETLRQIIGFFKRYMTNGSQFEALVNIVWDKELQRYDVIVPRQTVSRITVDARLDESFDPNRYIHVMDIHSHNSMAAKFSPIDNHDEKATRIYAVIGRLDKYWPDISMRISNGGKYLAIDPAIMFEEFNTAYPYDWQLQVALPDETPNLSREWLGWSDTDGAEQ